jgi:hypothetical protein
MGAVAKPRLPSPLIKPDVRVSRIRLSDWFHCKAHDGNPAPAPRAPEDQVTGESPGSATRNLMRGFDIAELDGEIWRGIGLLPDAARALPNTPAQ